MPFPILGVLALLSLAGCTLSFRYKREEKSRSLFGADPYKSLPKPAAEPKNLESNDPCPGHEYCACSEPTGWVPGKPLYHDHYVRIEYQTLDLQKELHTVKEPPTRIGLFKGERTTYFPQVDFEFKLNTAEPSDPQKFQFQTKHLTEELLKVILRKYRCVTEPFSNPFVVYVTGHTDTLASDDYNLKLSQARGQTVALAVMEWLKSHASELMQPVEIKFVGLGEKEAHEKGDPDQTPNPKQRRVDVVAVSTGDPFEADWQVLGVVQPTSTPATANDL